MVVLGGGDVSNERGKLLHLGHTAFFLLEYLATENPRLMTLQGHLAHEKLPPLGSYAWGPAVFLGGGAVSYERGTPVRARVPRRAFKSESHLVWTLGGVQGEQKILKGHLPRVVYHQVS